MKSSLMATTLLVVSVGSSLSDRFRSVQDEHGARMCSTADPHGVIPRIRSTSGCASVCSLDTNCSYFNFWSETKSCCLFHGPLKAVELIRGCAAYEKVNNLTSGLESEALGTSTIPSSTPVGIATTFEETSDSSFDISTAEPPPNDEVLDIVTSSSDSNCHLNRPAANATLMQRKIDTSVSFNKSWEEFRSGFNDSNGNFWLGNEQIHNMTSSSHCSLYLLFTTTANVTQYAVYSPFKIGKNSTFYKLSMKYTYQGNITFDPLTGYSGSAFSTFDSDHDLDPNYNCASSFKAGWWYGSFTMVQGGKCGITNLQSYSRMMTWRELYTNGTRRLKCTQMWLMC